MFTYSVTEVQSYNLTFVFFSAVIPDTLQVTPISLQTADFCINVWQDEIEFTDRMQCAGGDGVASSCSVSCH